LICSATSAEKSIPVRSQRSSLLRTTSGEAQSGQNTSGLSQINWLRERMPAREPSPPLASGAVTRGDEGPADWTFEVEETSNGVWRVTGTDRLGHSVQSSGTEVDVLMRQCQTWAQEIADRS
jgi:hypothetical protein